MNGNHGIVSKSDHFWLNFSFFCSFKKSEKFLFDLWTMTVTCLNYGVISTACYLFWRLTTELVGCIEKNYMRGTDFCSRRASDHFSNIFGNMLQTVGCTSGGGFTPFNVQYNPHNEQQYGGSVNFPSQQSGSWPINNAFPVPNNGEQQQGNKFNYEWNSNPTLVPPYNPNRSNDGNIMQAEISILTVIVNFVFMSKWVFWNTDFKLIKLCSRMQLTEIQWLIGYCAVGSVNLFIVCYPFVNVTHQKKVVENVAMKDLRA